MSYNLISKLKINFKLCSKQNFTSLKLEPQSKYKKNNELTNCCYLLVFLVDRLWQKLGQTQDGKFHQVFNVQSKWFKVQKIFEEQFSSTGF